MVTDRLSDLEVANAGSLRRRFAFDRPSADVFNALARLAAHVFDATVVLAFDDPPAAPLEFRFVRDASMHTAIACVPLVSTGGVPFGEIRVLDRVVRRLESPGASLLEEFATLVAQNYEARIELLHEREIERYRLEVLKLAANGAPLLQIFDSLAACVEYCIAGSICTVMTLNEGRLYRASSSPGIDAEYMAAIEGFEAGPEQGSCGTAAFLGRTVIVSDIRTDRLWSRYRALAKGAGLAACWSTPIVDSENAVLGTLAIYFRRPAEPTPSNLEFAHEAAHIAAIAVEAHAARVRLEQMALHDALTKLPNRALFENRMEQAIASARRTGRGVAIGLMDLNRFKIVNDSLGHAVGDQLLSDVAERLLHVVRPGDTVARMGGDEFLLLMTDLESRDAVRAIAERFVAILEPSFSPLGNEIFVQGSMGVSMYPHDSLDAPELLRLADSAMYSAKTGGERIAFYRGPSPTHAYSFSRLDLEASLHRALENDEFEMLFQPQIGFGAGEIVAAEALLRWRHPRLGVLEPERFFSMAEETGLTVAIGAWVLREACVFARRWSEAGGPGRVWVNVSPRQIEDANFVATVVAALEASGLRPSRLWLEITESLIMRMPSNAATKLGELRALGVRSAIDNFGRGNSSLSHLKHFPISALKIDPNLLRDVGREGAFADEAIVRAILDVGRALGLKIVADGVETELQRDFLQQNGCALAQGFYFARPLSIDDLLLPKASR